MIRAAIIGYGYMGEIRKRVIEAHPDLELGMVCETNAARLAGLPSTVQTTQNPNDVLNSNADLVFVCTPNNLIPELTVECLKRGKHVFAEKPPGRNLADVEAMRAEEAKHPELKLMFGFNHRYHPGIQRAKRHVESGKFGRLLWVRGIYGKSGGMSFKKSWRNDPEISGGGILLDQGIHMLDLFNYFCGDFEDVKAFTGNSFWDVAVEDNAFVILQNRKGQHGTLHSSATLWKHKFYIELGLEHGYLIVEGLLSKTGSYGRETLKVGRRQFEDEAEAVGNPSEEITSFDRDLSWDIEVGKIVECIKLKTPVTESSSEDAWRVMRIVDRAYKNSIGGGQ